VDERPPENKENDNLSLEEQMRERLVWLREEHRRIDNEITALMDTGVADVIKIKRMKKIKLSMKDQIAYLENQLTPDIIAYSSRLNSRLASQEIRTFYARFVIFVHRQIDVRFKQKHSKFITANTRSDIAISDIIFHSTRKGFQNAVTS